MGKIDVDVDLNGVPGRIERSIKDGIEGSGEELFEDGTKIAKRKIRREGAIFSGELLNSFTFESNKKGKVTLVEIENTADHAAPMESGAEYEEKGPPIEDLLPWVKTKLADWRVSQKWISIAKEYLDIPDGASDSEIRILAKALWLQQKIKRQGLEGKEFMKRMAQYLELYGDDIVADEIDKELRRRL